MILNTILIYAYVTAAMHGLPAISIKYFISVIDSESTYRDFETKLQGLQRNKGSGGDRFAKISLDEK